MSTFCYLNDMGIICALGAGKIAVAKRLLAGDASAMTQSDAWSVEQILTVGEVTAALPEVPGPLEIFRSRNNRLLLSALEEIRPSVEKAMARYGPNRVGAVAGTSTSGIGEAETAIARYMTEGSLPGDFHYRRMELVNPASFLATLLGLGGPAYTVSTACSSGAKALSSAMRLLRMRVCDAVVAGGADALCRFTVAGFCALEAVSPELCNPFSVNRKGINIGEGAALFLVSRDPEGVALLGVGESSDAHHMSAPDPAGTGARLAVESALMQARIGPSDVGYLNLHGTATAHNDAMEARLVHDLFGPELPCSSTKPLTGHTLGAAGAVEAGFCWLTLNDAYSGGQLPPHLWDGARDPALPAVALTTVGTRVPGLRYALSNSFAFGGSNACVVLGKV